MSRIDVRTPDGGYPVIVEEGLLGEAGPTLLEILGRATSCAVITSTTVGPLHARPLVESLAAAGFAGNVLEIPDGEAHKTLETTSGLFSRLLDAGLDRSTPVIALGGGVVGDVAGFTAATYMRGVPFVQAPTTLLAMVDASIGGKTGVDMPQGKNLVGAFKQPVAVLVDPAVLSTLPATEIANGMAEVIKHGLVGDAQLFEELASGPVRPAALIDRAIRVKVEIVQRDPFEQGERAHLNLGHTFGHALEAASGFTLPHGRAVGLGLVAAAHLSLGIGRCSDELPGRIRAAVEAQGLETVLPGLSPDEVLPHLAHDKKRDDGSLRFVIPEEPGSVDLVADPPGDRVRAALAHVLSRQE